MGPKFYNDLENKVLTWKKEYAQGMPYPHIVFDDFFPEDILNKMLEEFPSPDAEIWKKFNDSRQQKLGSVSDRLIPPYTRAVIQELNSGAFLDFLEELTGIKNLIADAKLAGGGLHQILPGGKLGIHADFNAHKGNGLDRRLNLLLYLNKDWQDDFGGEFELWDTEMKACQRKVLPVFNRCVVFSTTSFTFHGHPDPLMCPEGRSRKSLALYYYSNGRPEHEKTNKPHSTLFKERPGELFAEEDRAVSDKKVEPMALQKSKGDNLPSPKQLTVCDYTKRLVYLLTPPLISNSLKKAMSRQS